MNALDTAIEHFRDALVGTPGRLSAAVVIGLGVGMALRPGETIVPAVGAAPNILVGVALVAVGGAGFLKLRQVTDGCGCDGDCDCS